MALEPCPNCNHTISTLALACPVCGAPGEATRARVVVFQAAEGVPEAVEPPVVAAAPRPWLDTGKALLFLWALGAGLLGAIADAGVHRLLSGDAGVAAAESANALPAVLAAPRVQPASMVGDGAESARIRARQQEGVIAMKAALDDIALKEQARVAANHTYESNLDLLEYLPPAGVHVRLSAGSTWWSATAEHDSLPGFSCARGLGAAFTAGKVTCAGRDTAQAGLTPE